MATPDYSQLDAEILAEIGKGKVHFTQLASLLKSSAKTFCPDPKDEPFRVIDRRLQALRKKGKIGHDTKQGWRLRGADGAYLSRG